MENTSTFQIYTGSGKTFKQKGLKVPAYEPLIVSEDPKNYIPSAGLVDAVNVALALRQPLLITGEPGTGKTKLASNIAWELDIPLLCFFTKTTSTSSDLFYIYDALQRFHDAQIGKSKPIEEYITLQALGMAILMANPTDNSNKILPAQNQIEKPTRSVVLIDEIDKAPRDLPNDILNEIENMQFKIKESSWEPFVADPEFSPILILTSNSEKNLPDAFLRRCIFYHIEFPSFDALRQIMLKRFGDISNLGIDWSHNFIDAAIKHFMDIRTLNLRKKPATAEFIAWVNILRVLKINIQTLHMNDMDKLIRSYSVLAKNVEDYNQLKYFAKKVI